MNISKQGKPTKYKNSKSVNMHNNTVRRNLQFINNTSNTKILTKQTKLEEIPLHYNEKIKFALNNKCISDTLTSAKETVIPEKPATHNLNHNMPSLNLTANTLHDTLDEVSPQNLTQKIKKKIKNQKEIKFISTGSIDNKPNDNNEMALNSANTEEIRFTEINDSKSPNEYTYANKRQKHISSSILQNHNEEINQKNENFRQKSIPKLDMTKIMSSSGSLHSNKKNTQFGNKKLIESTKGIFQKEKIDTALLKKTQSRNDISRLFSISNRHFYDTPQQGYTNYHAQRDEYSSSFGENKYIIQGFSINTESNDETIPLSNKGNPDALFLKQVNSNITKQNILIDKQGKGFKANMRKMKLPSQGSYGFPNEKSQNSKDSDKSHTNIIESSIENREPKIPRTTVHSKNESLIGMQKISQEKMKESYTTAKTTQDLGEPRISDKFSLSPKLYLSFLSLNKDINPNDLLIDIEHKKEGNLEQGRCDLHDLIVPRLLDISNNNNTKDIYKSLTGSEEFLKLKKEIPIVFSITQASRHDLILLSKYVNNRIRGILEDKHVDDEEKARKIDEVYNIVLNEIIRQIAVECSERGKILYTIWTSYVSYFQDFKSIIEEKLIQSRRNISKETDRIKKTLNRLIDDRDITIHNLKQEIKTLIEKNQAIEIERDKLVLIDQQRDQKLAKYKTNLQIFKNQAHSFKNEKEFYYTKVQSLLARIPPVKTTENDAYHLQSKLALSPTIASSMRPMQDFKKKKLNLGSGGHPIRNSQHYQLKKSSTIANLHFNSSRNLSLDGSDNESESSSIEYILDHENNRIKVHDLNGIDHRNIHFYGNYVDNYTQMENDEELYAMKGTQTELSLMNPKFNKMFKDPQLFQDLLLEYRYLKDTKLKEEIDNLNEAEIVFMAKLGKQKLFGNDNLTHDGIQETEISSVDPSQYRLEECLGTDRSPKDSIRIHTVEGLDKPLSVFGQSNRKNNNYYCSTNADDNGNFIRQSESKACQADVETDKRQSKKDQMADKYSDSYAFGSPMKPLDEGIVLSVVSETDEGVRKNGRIWRALSKNYDSSIEKDQQPLVNERQECGNVGGGAGIGIGNSSIGSNPTPLTPKNAIFHTPFGKNGSINFPSLPLQLLEDGAYLKRTIRVSLNGTLLDDKTPMQAGNLSFGISKDTNRKTCKYLDSLVNSLKEIDHKIALIRVICFYKAEMQKVNDWREKYESLTKEIDQHVSMIKKLEGSNKEFKAKFHKAKSMIGKCLVFSTIDNPKHYLEGLTDTSLSSSCVQGQEEGIPITLGISYFDNEKTTESRGSSQLLNLPLAESKVEKSIVIGIKDKGIKLSSDNVKGNKSFTLSKKVIGEKRENIARLIIERLDNKSISNFKNYMPLKQILKLITQIYEEKISQNKSNPLVRREELNSFVYYSLSQQFTSANLAQHKFVIFILSIKKYLHIIRINLFAKFMGLLDSKANYTLNEFNKYLEGLEYTKTSHLGGTIINADTEPRHYIPYVRLLEYIKYFMESKIESEELQEFKKELECLKENSAKEDVNQVGVIDIDWGFIKIINKYRTICNRAKCTVNSVFKALDLDQKKACIEQEFILLYKHLEPEKYDESFVSNVFKDNYDMIWDNHEALSLEKFTIISVEFGLFSKLKQNQFLRINTKQEIPSKVKELKSNWLCIHKQIETNIHLIKKITNKHKEFLLKLFDKLTEKIHSIIISSSSYNDNVISNLEKAENGDDNEEDHYKPILLAYRILISEVGENSKNAEAFNG